MKEAPRSYADIIEELQSKIRILEDENRLLRDRLCEAGISYIDVVVDRPRNHTTRIRAPE